MPCVLLYLQTEGGLGTQQGVRNARGKDGGFTYFHAVRAGTGAGEMGERVGWYTRWAWLGRRGCVCVWWKSLREIVCVWGWDGMGWDEMGWGGSTTVVEPVVAGETYSVH